MVNVQMDISNLVLSPEFQACTSSCLLLISTDYPRGILDIELNFCPFPHPKHALPTAIPFSVTGGYILPVG